MIAIVDYQSGNLGAIKNMLKRIGTEASIISDPADLTNATKIILPGVGTFDTGMKNLEAGGWILPLNKKVLQEKIPVLGICLGMQLMTMGSEEGNLKGLEWIDGFTKRFSFQNKKTLKVPHMGWNRVQLSKSSKLLISNNQETRFYFAHAYYVELNDRSDELLKTEYGYPFSSALEKGNIVGVQFHPEKSHRFGKELLENFIKNF